MHFVGFIICSLSGFRAFDASESEQFGLQLKAPFGEMARSKARRLQL